MSSHHLLLLHLLGAVIPLSLGYALGACWEAGSNLLGALSGLAFILFLAQGH